MRYKYILTGIFLMLWLSATAQLGDQRHNWAIGVSGGMNYNNVTFEPKIKQKGLLSMTGGVTARYISEKYFAMICGLQMEINFSPRGWEERIEENTDTYRRTMNYLEVPFLAHLAFGKEKRGLQFFLNLGPQFNYLLSEKEKYSDHWDPTNRPKGVNQQYGMMADKRFDYGIVGGLGVELKSSIGNFLLEGRYYFGLADFYNNSKKDIFARSANTTISAKLTYLFDLSK